MLQPVDSGYTSRYSPTKRAPQTSVYGNPGVWGTAGTGTATRVPSPYTANNPYQSIYRGYTAPQINVAPVRQRQTQPQGQTPWVPQAPGPPTGAGYTPRADNPYPDLKGINYAADPVLQDVISGNNARLAGERARRLEEQKKLMLAFGSKEMARKLLGEDPFVDTISDDPMTSLSTLGLNRRQEIDDTRMANEELNKGNLFFSSARGQSLAEIARARTLRDAQATNEFQSGLNSLDDQYAAAENDVSASRRGAEQEAYNRAIQDAIQKWWNAQNAPLPAGSSAAPPGGGAGYPGGGTPPPNSLPDTINGPTNGATYAPVTATNPGYAIQTGSPASVSAAADQVVQNWTANPTDPNDEYLRALAARSAGMNALYGLGQYATAPTNTGGYVPNLDTYFARAQRMGFE